MGDSKSDPHYHNNFQDPEAFLAAGGYRGRQHHVLTEGTYFINRLFATAEYIDKTIVDVGETGVVVSFYGEKGVDVSGEAYSHGELCAQGGRGIWDISLLPGKYAFNTYAGHVIKVPTINLILKWDKTQQSDHKLDDSLREIGLITKDAFEPELPLSVVISIDYRKAPYVIQRFGSVRQLIEQSLDPLVSSYFKNEGQKRTLIELIQERSQIQVQATSDMKSRFLAYDLNLQEVLIGTPHSKPGDTQIETILNQLRDRQVAMEQKETYAKQQEAQGALTDLNKAKAIAEMQASVTQSNISITVQENQGKAEATRATQEAAKTVTMSEAESRRIQLMAEADARRIEVTATSQAKGIARTKMAEAIGVEKLQEAYGGPKIMVIKEAALAFAEALKEGQVQIVPKTQVNMGGENGGGLIDFFSLFGLQKLGLVENMGEEAVKKSDKVETPLEKEMRQDAENVLGLNQPKPDQPKEEK